MIVSSQKVNSHSFDAWLLSWLISPRGSVRLADKDVSGLVLNSYSRSYGLDGVCPDVPWAVHLHDRTGRLSLVVFDFDTGPGLDPANDCDRLVSILKEVGVQYVVCDSGSGGRHVWVRLVSGDSLDGRYLGRCLKPFFRSLDISPLSNAGSGAVRPPGSPHRNGGVSTIIAGRLGVLLEPTTQAHELLRVCDLVIEQYGATTGISHSSAFELPERQVVKLDRIPGPLRSLPAEIIALVDAVPTGDASSLLWRIFLAAARCHWSFDDVWALKDRPGLEHIRSIRSSARKRTPRPTRGRGSSRQVAYRQWQRAISAVQSFTPAGTDNTWDTRARQVAISLMTVLDRAGAMPGRWQGAGASQRRILDALCLFAAQGVSLTIEADIRRIAMTAGLSRETVRQGLHALNDDGWITLHTPGAGRVAHRWKILSTSNTTQRLSQGFPPPAGATLRAALISDLTTRISHYARDVFTSQGLGISAGNTYADLHANARPSKEAHHDLHRLEAWGIIDKDNNEYRPLRVDLDRLADILGCAGTLATRAAAYILERELWAWVCAEIQWLQTSGAKPKRHQLKQNTVLWLHGQYPAYPRTSAGGLNHKIAHEIITVI